MRLRFAAAVLSGALAAGAPANAPARVTAADGVSLLDLVEVDYAYTTLEDHSARAIDTQGLLDGARGGLVAALRAQGVTRPAVAVMHARPDGRGVVPAIDRQIALALERYGTRIAARDLVAGAIRGEVASLGDPYSVFFTPADMKGFTRALDGASFGGIGVALAEDVSARRWRAETVFPNGPAAAAGVRDGDVIVSVDGVALAGLSDEQVSAALRGATGTVVRLTLERDGAPLAAPVAVTRAVVTPPEVTARLLPANVGYVALHSFPLDAGAQVRSAVQRLLAQGARAVVFDLRGNGGGYESAAVHVASVFIAAGPVVANQGRRGPRRVSLADGDALPPTPLAALVDHDSASGAELVAGALQDRKRATLIGEPTYRKGVAQEIFPLPDGSAIKLTTMRYFTAGGRFIDRTGLQPDIIVAEPSGAVRGTPGRDPQLDRALAVLAPGT